MSLNFWQFTRAWLHYRFLEETGALNEPEVVEALGIEPDRVLSDLGITEYLDAMAWRAQQALEEGGKQDLPMLRDVLGMQGGPGRGSDFETLRKADRASMASEEYSLARLHGCGETEAWEIAAEMAKWKNPSHARANVREALGNDEEWHIGRVWERIDETLAARRRSAKSGADLARNDANGAKKDD